MSNITKRARPVSRARGERTTQARTLRTRAEILDAAWKLFVRRGAAVSMSEVAEASNLTRQAVYVHFRSRGGLLVALVRRADERAGIQAKYRAALAERDARRRLEAFLGVWFEFVPTIHPVAATLMRARADDPEAHAAWRDRMDELRGGFRALTNSLQRDGALAAGWTAATAADYLWAGSSMQVWELLVVDRGWSEARAAKTLRTSLARAVLVSAS